MFTGAHDKLVDKRMFTTLLMQLKAAVLVKVLHKLFVQELPYTNNMKTSIVLTVAHEQYNKHIIVLTTSAFRIIYA